jgi:RNA recognition motif-containing protein
VGTKLYVRNLNPETTERELYDLFAGIGGVRSVLVPVDRVTGKNKNLCTVEMESSALAKLAQHKTNGLIFNGLPLEVAENRPPNLRSSPV